MPCAVFLRQANEGINNGIGSKATSQTKAIELSAQRSSRISIALMDDFLVGRVARWGRIVRKTMGEGVGVDESSHCMKKRPPNGSLNAFACQSAPLPSCQLPAMIWAAMSPLSLLGLLGLAGRVLNTSSANFAFDCHCSKLTALSLDGDSRRARGFQEPRAV